MKGTIYYAAIAKVIFSHVKISSFRALTWYFIGVYIIRLSTCTWSHVNINTHENDNQLFSEHIRQKLSPQITRNGISEHQEGKICRRAYPHTLLAACAFSTRKIHQWLKNIPIFHTQNLVGQSSGVGRFLVNLSEENRSYY